MVTLTYPLASDPLSWDQQATWGQSGVEVSKPAGYAVCDGIVSSSFFVVVVATSLTNDQFSLVVLGKNKNKI